MESRSKAEGGRGIKVKKITLPKEMQEGWNKAQASDIRKT